MKQPAQPTARMEARLANEVLARLKHAAEIQGAPLPTSWSPPPTRLRAAPLREPKLSAFPPRAAPVCRGDTESSQTDRGTKEGLSPASRVVRRGMNPFRNEPLSDRRDRTRFRSGEEALDRYFQKQSTQDIRRRVANCFVAVQAATGQVAACYTLSAGSIAFGDLPPEESKRSPRYPALPAARVGRLAVDERFQRRGLGAAMLADAAVFALLVDAKNDRAVAFYQKYGFRALAGHPRTLFLPLATARKALISSPSPTLRP